MSLLLINGIQTLKQEKEGKEIMKCLQCQGTLKRGLAPYTINRKNYHLIIDQLPAWICEDCGEPLFEAEEVDVIQEIVKSTDNKLNNVLRKVA